MSSEEITDSYGRSYLTNEMKLEPNDVWGAKLDRHLVKLDVVIPLSEFKKRLLTPGLSSRSFCEVEDCSVEGCKNQFVVLFGKPQNVNQQQCYECGKYFCNTCTDEKRK